MPADEFPSVAEGSLAAGYRLVGRLRRGPQFTIYRAIRDADGRDVLLTVPVAEHPVEEVAERLRQLPPQPHLSGVLEVGRTVTGLPFIAIGYHPDPSSDEPGVAAGQLPVEEVVRMSTAAFAAPAVEGPPAAEAPPVPGAGPVAELAAEGGRRTARSWVEVRPQGDTIPASPAASPAWLADLDATLDGYAPAPAPAGGSGPERPDRPRARWLGRLGLVGAAAFAVGLVVTYAVSWVDGAPADQPPPAAEQPAPAGTATPAAPSTPEPAGVPADVVVAADEQFAVTLSWRNQGASEFPVTVIGGPVGSDQEVLASAAPGETTLRINGLNPELEYCFQVVVARSVDADGISASDPVCTSRG